MWVQESRKRGGRTRPNEAEAANDRPSEQGKEKTSTDTIKQKKKKTTAIKKAVAALGRPISMNEPRAGGQVEGKNNKKMQANDDKVE